MDHPALPESEFHEIYSRVPRLTVEVVVAGPAGLLLTRRESGPCAGLWHIPGGTVRFGERLEAAVHRVAADELGCDLVAGPFLGYIEYPSHYRNGPDSPVGLAFLCEVGPGQDLVTDGSRRWFTTLPEPMHVEQVEFLTTHGLPTPTP